MKLIKSSFEILDQEPGLQGIYKQIELAGRTCYKSLDKITEDSAEGFVNRMIASKHYAMLEHGTVYLTIVEDLWNTGLDSPTRYTYEKNPYSRVVEKAFDDQYYYFITTNYRVLVENDWLEDLKYLCEPTEYHEKRVTVRFTTDRGVSHEFVRHRVFSFAQESTRYCNYSKNKFNNELTFIIPSWLDIPENEYGTIDNPKDIQFKKHNSQFELEFINHLINAEFRYMEIIKAGYTSQQARQVLPNALKTELVMTGFVSDWQHFFDLRARGTTGAPHPDAKALAEPLMKEFIQRKYINEEI